MSKRETKKPQRRPYEKPRLRVIDLAAQEVLGIGCKLASVAGPGGPCDISPCSGEDTT